MKDSDITVIDAIKNTKLSSIKKLVWMLWRLFVLLFLLFTLAILCLLIFIEGVNSVYDVWILLLVVAGLVLSLAELKTGTVSAVMIKMLTKNPNIKQH